MYVHITYARPLSVQDQYRRSCPTFSSSCYNGSLVTWTIVCLTVAKFKPLIFPKFYKSKSKLKSHCDFRSVSQFVLVSSCIWSSWPDIYYCLTVTVLFLWGDLSDERKGRLLYILLALASTVFLGSESLGTRDHILLSQIWDFLFRRLLQLAGQKTPFLCCCTIVAFVFSAARTCLRSGCLEMPLVYVLVSRSLHNNSTHNIIMNG
jgi:hypothetical protein